MMKDTIERKKETNSELYKNGSKENIVSYKSINKESGWESREPGTKHS